MGFSCDSCGLCCQNIGNIEELRDFDLGKGVCKYYNPKTKLCKIYNSRPLVCRVDEMYDCVFSTFMTRERFYTLNQNVCVDLKYKIKE